ncbi:MAG: CotH kinase family protein, partial [Treponema sp.]|nr:CotH kinase family protein [Treponema sp.]
WYSVQDGESEGSAIENETSTTLKIRTEHLGKTGYYCVVTNTIADNGDGGKKVAEAKSATIWIDAVYLKDIVSAPEFTVQPQAMSVAPYNRSIELSCAAESAQGNVSYRWYESADGTSATGTAVIGETSATLTTPTFTERGIRYFYCVATVILSADEGEEIKCVAAVSDVVSVACTRLPVVTVETPERVAITSKEIWTENATIAISGASDDSWNFDAVTTSIRGRGNSTWGQPKKPYALKLDKKQKIMGMPKHKRWVLIANYLDNSFMRNEMAFYLSEQVGLDWTVHGEFVDFVLNGEYKGLYWLGEAIKVDENRVNINDGTEAMTDDEDKDYLIEMDVYYDEIVKFKSSVRNMPYMIKNDDYMIDDSDAITSGGEARLNRLQQKITALEEKLYPDFTEGMNTNSCSVPDEAYSEMLDIDSWAKFWLVNEIMDNGELDHPKSCYFTFDSTNNVLKAGPVWDFDWAALGQASSCRLKGTIYYNALFKSPTFTARTKELWGESYAKIDIATQIETIREQIYVAQQYDTMRWGAHNDPSGIVRADFDAYVDFLKDILEKKLAVVNADVTGL